MRLEFLQRKSIRNPGFLNLNFFFFSKTTLVEGWNWNVSRKLFNGLSRLKKKYIITLLHIDSDEGNF